MEDGPWSLLHVLYLLCSLTWPVAVGKQVSDTQVTLCAPFCRPPPLNSLLRSLCISSSSMVLSLHLFPDSASNLVPLVVDGSLSLLRAMQLPGSVLFSCGCFCKQPRLAGAGPQHLLYKQCNGCLHAGSASPRSCSGPACESPCLSCCLQMSLPMLARRPEPGCGAPSRLGGGKSQDHCFEHDLQCHSLQVTEPTTPNSDMSLE